MVKAKKGSGTSKRYKGNPSSGESRSLQLSSTNHTNHHSHVAAVKPSRFVNVRDVFVDLSNDCTVILDRCYKATLAQLEGSRRLSRGFCNDAWDGVHVRHQCSIG
jgi:hypothetical protein